MKHQKTKLFWKMKSDSRHIYCVPYDDNAEYYTFLRNCRDEGYRQVIITSEIMIEIIRQACLEKGYRVYKIEFVEEDLDLENEINVILRAMEKNPAYLSELLEKLKFLSEKSSIDLKRIYIKSLYTGDVYDDYFVQSNGIVGINKESFTKISTEIIALVERCLS